MIRWAASELVYQIACGVQAICYRFDAGYPFYNWLFIKSFDIQGCGKGPWIVPDLDEGG